MLRKLAVLALIAIVLVVAFVYAGIYVRGRIETAVTQQLPTRIGPAKSYATKASGGALGMMRGHIDSIVVHGEGVRVRDSVLLDTMDVALHGITFDPRQRRLSGIRRADFVVTLNENELNNYMRQCRPDIGELDINLLNGHFTVSARPAMALDRSTITAEGTLSIIDGDKLVLDLSSARAPTRPVSETHRALLQDSMNPILDISGVKFHPKLTSVTITPGRLKLTGVVEHITTR